MLESIHRMSDRGEESVQNHMADIGARVAGMRAASGLSIDDLSQRTSLSVSAVQRLEAGEGGLAGHEVLELASALECQPDDLLYGKEPAAALFRGESNGADDSLLAWANGVADDYRFLKALVGD